MTTPRIAYDISVLLGPESIDYPGDTPYRRELIVALSAGGMCNLSQLEMSAHSGTHIDAPAHFIADGKTIDQLPIHDFLRPAVVVEPQVDGQALGATVLDGEEIRPGDAVLFKTENSSSGRCRSGSFAQDFVHVTAEAADACVARGVGLVGIDYITIERLGNPAFPAHHRLLGKGVLVLEGLNLAQVPPGRYLLSCLPLRIEGAEAAPVRAVLFDPNVVMG